MLCLSDTLCVQLFYICIISHFGVQGVTLHTDYKAKHRLQCECDYLTATLFQQRVQSVEFLEGHNIHQLQLRHTSRFHLFLVRHCIMCKFRALEHNEDILPIIINLFRIIQLINVTRQQCLTMILALKKQKRTLYQRRSHWFLIQLPQSEFDPTSLTL